MAVIIDKGIYNNDPANRKHAIWSPFVNHIVEFHSDTITNPLFAIVGGLAKIYPDANGKFKYNIGDYFKMRYKQIHSSYKNDIFADKEIIPTDLIAINDDRFGSSGINIGFYVYSDTNTYETTAINWILLSPFHKKYLEKQYIIYEDGAKYELFAGEKITIFDGFIFEMVSFNVSYVKDVNENIQIAQNLGKRGFLSLPEKRIQSNELIIYQNIDGNSVKVGTINVKYRNCDGVQLKWFGNGTWKYWVFNKNKKADLLLKELGEIANNFIDDEFNTSPIIQLGKTAKKHLTLATMNLEPHEVEYIQDLFTSPKVYLNRNVKGQATTINDFLEIKLLTKNVTLENFKKNISKIEIVIEIPTKTMY